MSSSRVFARWTSRWAACLGLLCGFTLAPVRADADRGADGAACRYGALPTPAQPATRNQTAGVSRLAAYYVVPDGIDYDPLVHQRLIEATLEIQAWYQCASGGHTWLFASDDVVEVYRGLESRLYYRDNGDWWGSLLEEMRSQGEPIWQPGTIAAVWAQGAGWWAGGAQACRGECGVALVGVESFPEFNRPEWSGDECPDALGNRAWPCTPLGAMAHEIGHTLGLPHPLDRPQTADDAFHSVMQTHANYPNFAPPDSSPWGFLTFERFHMSVPDFLQPNVQTKAGPMRCDVVNLPVVGSVPVPDFDYEVDALGDLYLTDRSTGAARSFWTFGDGLISNEESPIHTYTESGTYRIQQRVQSASFMVAAHETETEIEVTVPDGREICVPDNTTLCLLDGRFQFKVAWDTGTETGEGRIVPGGTDNASNVYFFRPTNWEMMIKALDGCNVNGQYWIFFSGTTNVGFTVTVTDTGVAPARVKTYANPRGQPADAVLDTQAFATCVP